MGCHRRKEQAPIRWCRIEEITGESKVEKVCWLSLAKLNLYKIVFRLLWIDLHKQYL